MTKKSLTSGINLPGTQLEPESEGKQKTVLTLQDLEPEHIAEAQANGMLPEELLAVYQAEADYTRQTLEKPTIYPPKGRHLKITAKGAMKLGFAGRGPMAKDIEGLTEAKSGDFLSEILCDFRDKGYPKKRKGKGKGKDGKRLADPAVVFGEVDRILKSVPDAETIEDFVVLEFNGEFLDARKAAFFLDTYEVIVKKGHILAGSEVTLDGLRLIAKAISEFDRQAKNLPAGTPDRFVAIGGQENSRGQGIGAIVDTERFEISGTYEIDSVRTVFGIPDLRAAFVIKGKDKKTGQEMRIVIEHLKSMRGGPESTAKVRTKQIQLTIADLGTGQPCGVSGMQPSEWLQAIAAHNFNFWRNELLGRDLSDHGLNRYVLNVTKTPDPSEEITIITGDFNSKLDTAKDVTGVLEPLGYFLAGKEGLVPTQITGPSVLDGLFNDRRDGPYTSEIIEVDCT